MAEGYVMTIPKSVLDKLTQADNKIKDIAKSSENTERRVIESFKNMANGINPFLEKLNALKSLSNLKIDTALKSSATSAEKTANSVAQVAIQLNRVAESPINVVEGKFSLFRNTIVDTSEKVSKLKTDITGMLSSASQTNTTNAQPTIIDAGQVKALQLQRAELQQNQKYWKQYIDNLAGSSIASQRQKAEMDKLNASFRNGNSLLQRQTRAEDEFGKAVGKAVTALDKAARAEERKNAARSNKEAQAAARAEGQYARALTRSEVTIVQRARKIEALTNAQRALTATGRDYSAYLSRITSETQRLQKANNDAANSMDKLKSNQSKVLDISGQLARQFALLFSVSAIKGYMDKLVAVRGEFELQQTALRSILQDKEKADEVWNKTVQLAVKSPFTVKELVTYTKQLAAYRVEADKLYDTNKMLADVSAGLGVSMDRLILAFGQVKAANYLRASEVRQFTEAGVNILGELSTIYTELEGRMVSVAEVQDRITKRMVKFGDVEEVFQRITSAGGIFYNMQEVQAETLAGMMSNLQDTFDLMFNEIGKANEGVLKGFVSLLRDIVNSWEKIAQVGVPIISILVSRWALLKGVMMLTSLASAKFVKGTVGGLKLVSLSMMQTTAATERMTAMIKKSSGASVFGGWVTILSTVSLIAWEIYNAISATHESQRKMNRTISEGVQSASEMSQKFKILADTVVDSTKSAEDQKKALDELKRSYGDVVSTEQLTIENLQKMKGNYDAVTAAIYAKIEASDREKLLAQVQDEEGEAATQAMEGLRDGLVKFGVSAGTARQMVHQLEQDFKQGLIKTPEEGIARIRELIDQFTTLDSTLYIQGKGFTTWGNVVAFQTRNTIAKLQAYEDKVNDISGLNIQPLTFGDLPAAKEMDSLFNAVTASVEKWKKDNQDKLSPFELSEGAKQKAIEEYRKFIKEIEDSLKGEGTIKLDDRSFIIASKFLEKADKSIEKLKGTTIQQEVGRIIKEAFKDVGANLDDSVQLMLGDEEGMKEYVKRFNQTLEYLKEQIDLFNSHPLLSPFGNDPEKMQAMTKQFEAMLLAQKKLPSYEKQKGTGESEADKRLKKQLSLLKEIGKAYEDNLKYYNKEEAAAKTKLDYAAAAKEAGVGDLVTTMTFDPSGIISGIEEIGKQASKKMKLDVERSIADIKGKAEIEVRAENIEQTKKQLEELFAGYEITVEMGKLGMDKSLISQLFNIDTFSIADIKKKLEQIYPDVSKLSQEQLKVYNETSKKILSLEQKDLEERLKTYSTYLKKSMSERVRIEMEGQAKIAKIPSNFSSSQRSQITDNIKKETEKALAQQSWNDFKNSEMYVSLFEDLGAVSTQTLNLMQAKLQELRASLHELDPQQLKEIQDKYNALSSEIMSRNPFKNLGENVRNYIKDFKDLKDLEGKSIKSQSEYENQMDLVDILTKRVSQERQANAEIQNRADISAYDKAISTAQLAASEAQLEEEIRLLSIKKNISIEDAKQLVTQRQKVSNTQKQVQSVAQIGSQAVGSAQELIGMLENFGVNFGEEIGGVLSGLGQAFGGLEKIDLTKPMSIVSGAVSVVAGIGNAIASIFGAGNKDNKKEKQIQKEIKLVEKLQHSYEKLEKAIENAYTIDTINATYANATKNLEEQIQSYQNMIEAEKSKKKTDWDKINQWENEMDNLRTKQDELQQQKAKEMGGFGSGSEMKSAAEEFASAWMEAYKETGDGLDALNDKWDEFIQNIVVKQLALRGISKFLEPIMNQIDAAIGNDSYLSNDELAKIKENIEKLTPQMNDFFKSVMNGFGDLLPKPGSNNTELSGLSSSIQGISEEQAGVIEGYLNSVRFFVSDISIETRRLTAALLDESIPNPMLNELRIQTELTRSIYSFLDSVIISGHRMGRNGVKVFID